MLAKVFEYTDIKNNSSLYLNGPDSADPNKLLELYIEWYNKDFAPLENLPEKKYEDFKFVCSFCPIDFYDDYYMSFKFQEMKNV